MKTKNVIYAAVGAPVVAARKVGDTVSELRSKLSEGAADYGKAAEAAFDKWAAEGEKVLNRITEGKVVDELTAKVDLDQAKEQVTKLRDQLEDMLATWRTSFRPEKPAAQTSNGPAKTPAEKPAASKPAAPKSAAAKPAAKSGAKTSAAKTVKSSAAKTSSEKSESAPADKAS